ncbi:helix-turn-helix domain-containing protein, partial [Nocardioides sp.]|uniref:helix-turn-helix domain-containing protein n=1 Tax=Nocardioides sp. TaxID=35761 RepID=UPI003565BB93
ADRTRIRPHVIESIEVDDFVPCGGDFYARGHLRTLARVLGIDVAPLLAAYDERYAAADVNPRRVFEAELATGMTGSIRGTRGGPNWSVLVAVVMTLVLAWSIARLVMDSPVQITPPAPQLNGSAGPNNSIQLLGDPVPVVLTAVGGGASVVVRDGAGNVIFSGDLSFNESRTLQRVAPPVRVQSSDGSLNVTVNGEDRGALGAEGQPAQNTFPVR